MKRIFLILVLFGVIAIPGFSQEGGDGAATSSLTIEIPNGALLVSGPMSALADIEKALPGLAMSLRTIDAVRAFVRERVGDVLTVEMFAASDIADLPDVTVIELPLRQAVLDGWIPPIEGLEVGDLEALLVAFKLRPIPYMDFSALRQEQRISLLYDSPTALFVYGGTGAYDTVSLYIRRSDAAAGEGTP